jgi:hypothetical protein
MHFSNLTVHIWQEVNEGIGAGQGSLAAEFSGKVTVLAVGHTGTTVKSWNSRRLSHCPRLRAAARPAWATGGRRAA